MNIKKDNLLYSIIGLTVLVNLFIILDLEIYYLRETLTPFFILIIPGLLLKSLLKIETSNIWEKIIYAISLSIFSIMSLGLIISWILPLFGIQKPLSLTPVLITINVFILILWITIYLNDKKVIYSIKLRKYSNTEIIMLAFSTIFPFLSIGGAFMLNNNGPNYLVLIMLGTIALYVLVLIFIHKKVDANLYPYIIFMLSVSLLLMCSMRSWHISGYDIHDEFRIFQVTKETGIWNMSTFPESTYNSCLDITILPTIISIFTKISDEYIFKLIFPLVFALVPVIMYLVFKKYVKGIKAFLACFFFISQIWFMAQQPTIARQEIALLFFCIILLVIFNDTITSKKKLVLYSICSFSMVVSHYSTSYIAIVLLTGAFIFGIIFKKINKIFISKHLSSRKIFRCKLRGARDQHIRSIHIFLLIIFIILWIGPITKTAGATKDAVLLNIADFPQILSQYKITEIVKRMTFNKDSLDTTKNIQNMLKDIEFQYKSYRLDLYDKNKTSNYYVYPISKKQIKSIISNSDLQRIVIYLNRILSFLINVIFIPLGLLCLIYLSISNKMRIDSELVIIMLLGIALIIFTIIVPHQLILYNLSRVYLQSLTVLCLPAIIGGLTAFSFISNVRKQIVGIIFVLFFLISTGFIFQLFGGGDTTFMHLNNYGDEFDRHYTHESEIASTKWLSLNMQRLTLVYADELANLRLVSFGNVYMLKYEIFPHTIDKNAYVYLSYANLNERKAFIMYADDVLSYNYPVDFLNDNKNLLYSNGGSAVYK